MGNAMHTMDQLIICPEGNFAELWTADPNGCIEQYTAVVVNIFPQKGIEDGGLGEDGYEGKGFMVAAIERKKPGHVELVRLWPKESDAGWKGTIENFRESTLPKLPYVQMYSDGVITIGDTAIVDSILPAHPSYKAVRKYVDDLVTPVRKELAKRLKQIKNSL